MIVVQETCYKWTSKHGQLHHRWVWLENGLPQRDLRLSISDSREFWIWKMGASTSSEYILEFSYAICISIWSFDHVGPFDVTLLMTDRSGTQGCAHRRCIRTAHSTIVSTCVSFWRSSEVLWQWHMTLHSILLIKSKGRKVLFIDQLLYDISFKFLSDHVKWVLRSSLYIKEI